jgi:ATP-dependent Clp protease ATP-binding subunit ClpA
VVKEVPSPKVILFYSLTKFTRLWVQEVAEGAMDAANIFACRGELRAIRTATTDEYQIL